MARTTPGTAQGDFFIIVGDLTTLDANAKDPGYAVFGHVVEGMDVVNRILDAPTSPTLGSPAMKGQMIAKPVPLTSARRLK
jgi:peptidyl-prolyl cis-trans isomerase A (cyclophilin A)